jgi:hypothetical protein
MSQRQFARIKYPQEGAKEGPHWGWVPGFDDVRQFGK